MRASLLWNTGAKSDCYLLHPSTDVLQDAKPCLPCAWNRWVVCPAGVLILEAHFSTFYHKPVLWIRICQNLSSILKITKSLTSIYSCAQSLMKSAYEINGTVQSFLPLCAWTAKRSMCHFQLSKFVYLMLWKTSFWNLRCNFLIRMLLIWANQECSAEQWGPRVYFLDSESTRNSGSS